MANENLVKFFEMVKSNQSIQSDIMNAANEEEAIKKAMQHAQEHGLNFTESDMSSYVSEFLPPSRELNDVELVTVAGGFAIPPVTAQQKAIRCLGSGFWCVVYMTEY